MVLAMHKMDVTKLLLLSSLIATSAAQDNVLSALLSDAQSIYTVVTSVLAPASTSASASTTSSSSSTTSSTTSSSSSASPTSSPSSSPSPTSAPAAAQSTAAVANSNNAGSDTLAIVLGCTLGALALAVILGLLYFCLRRRRRSSKFAKHRTFSPSYDEIDSWRHEKPSVRSLKEAEEHVSPLRSITASAPLISEQSFEQYNNSHHQNPFVPVPPPARRSSRPGIHDTEYSAHPYSPEDVNAHEPYAYGGQHNVNHNNQAFAAGVYGASLGGLAANVKDRHDRKRSASRGRNATSDTGFSEDEHNALPQATVADRRSGSVGRASAKEPWPYMDAHERRSMDSAKSRKRSMSRSQEGYFTPEPHPADSRTMPSAAGLAGAAAVGGLAGVAASRQNHSRSPHRKGILKQTISDSSDPYSSSDGRTIDTSSSRNLAAHNSGPHELASTNYPMAPTARERRNSALGTAAPFAAAAAHRNRNSRSMSPNHTPRPLSIPDTPRDFDPPIVPSRSPHRRSLDYRGARYSTANEGTVELPVENHNARAELVSPPIEPQLGNTNDYDGVISPISPLTSSQPGTWSKAQADELGMNYPLVGNRPMSQVSTVVNSASAEHGSHENPDHHSSGLVSAIQRIFSSQKTAWADGDSHVHDQNVRRSSENAYEANHGHDSTVSVPHREPAPDRSSFHHDSHHCDTTQPSTATDPTPAYDKEPLQEQTQALLRKSGESTGSQPPQYRPRGDSVGKTTSATDFASTSVTAAAMNTTRPRAVSRPGYGLNSGDPFDLARGRTDSSMTGISLSNYQEPAKDPRPQSARTSSNSNKYQEPTLAELRREVQEEDRERARASYLSRHGHKERRSGSNGSAGLRYGDDRELFDLVDQTTGVRKAIADENASGDISSGRFYGQGNTERRSRGMSVGRAY